MFKITIQLKLILHMWKIVLMEFDKIKKSKWKKILKNSIKKKSMQRTFNLYLEQKRGKRKYWFSLK